MIIDEDRIDQKANQDIEHIPWHISNRYYDVDVHFKISQNEALRPSRTRSNITSRLAPRQARMRIDQSSSQKNTTEVKEDDHILDQRARDVFAALEMGPPSTSSIASNGSNSRNADTELADRLREEVKDVQAVMIIVDRSQSLSEHQKLMDRLCSEKDGLPLLSGFDLAISLIVALPSPLDDATRPTSFTDISYSSGIEELYAGQGWEYVDLARMVSEKVDTMLLSEQEEEGSISFSDDVEDEKQGIERLREALMTHAWPGLERKQDRKQKGASLTLDNYTDDHLTKTLESLRLDLDAIDEAGKTEPTEKDEQLAKLFMARILSAQQAGLGQDGQTNGRTNARIGDSNVADMQIALEEFLESNDPGLFSTQSRQIHSEADEAWIVNDAKAHVSDQKEAFEDDFTEFVQADVTNSTNDAGFNGLDSLDEDELGFIGDEDDAFLLRALSEQERSQRVTGTHSHNTNSAGPQIDFESTLQAVLAQAERVRAIPDHNLRREEAAKVALALLDQ